MNILTFLGMVSMIFVAAFTWRTYTKPGIERQVRREAIIEAWVNIVIGFSANFLANLVLIPMMSHGGTLSASSNWWGGWVYTAISVVRNYSVRRWCSAAIQRFIKWLAQWRALA